MCLPWALPVVPFAAMVLLGVGVARAQDAVEKQGPLKVRWVDDGQRTAVVKTVGRKGAGQRFLLLLPETPRAAVVLFPGGGGAVGLGKDGSLRHESNFVVRTRGQYVDAGYAVALLDLPTDRKTLRGGFRLSPAHLLDIKSVIAFLRKRLGVPVWLVGTSRGTVSVAQAAAQLTGADGPDGIVLTAALYAATDESVYRADPEAIRVPTLLVHHVADACRVTPYADAAPYLERLVRAPDRQLVTIEGGGPPRGEPCKALHYHGFIGQEVETVSRIVRWIDARLARKP